MERSEWAYLLWFQHIEGIGTFHLDKIRSEFGSFTEAYQAPASQWFRKGWPQSLIKRLLDRRPAPSPEGLIDYVKAAGIELLCCTDARYPDCLRNIANYPYILYCRGNLDFLSNNCVAIVGSRRCSSYGREVARQMAAGISGSGVTVVSGLARGIDAAAHTGALTGPGSTIAVLGGGLDRIYPAENRRLFNRIAEEGLIISDYPPGTEPYAAHFPARNRIISGLSRAVLVVEAQLRSGALITADLALEQGREVMAVPGPITSITSAGTNHLIRQGARLVSGLDDIWEETGLQPFMNLNDRGDSSIRCGTINLGRRENLDQEQRKILEWLQNGAMSMDELLAVSRWEIGTLARALLQLEITGLVKSKPGNYYIMSTGH